MSTPAATDAAAAAAEQDLCEARAWFERYTELFFSEQALAPMLAYMCNACPLEVADPVCDTLTVFLSNTVTFAVTNVGLIPFRNASMSVFPFSHMTEAQRAFLLEYIAFLRRHWLGLTSTQMGGGCVVSLAQRASNTLHLDAVTVLSVMTRSVLESATYGDFDARVSVCNIVLQRLGARVHLSRESMRKLHTTVLKPARLAHSES
jgi:hypothetical protein